MIITFVLVGKYLEILSKKRAVDTLDKIIGTMPTEARVVKDGQKYFIPIENIEKGDIIELKAGERVPVDGKLVSGSAMFDESSITGESEPIFKKVGDEVLSGVICTDSIIRFKAIRKSDESMLQNIIHLLR